MIYTEMTSKAMIIAYNAHHGNLDVANIPYVFHPIHLAEQMNDEKSCTAALLHDVIEHTSLSIDDLKKEFPNDIVNIVELLTHDPKIDYFDYIRKIKNNPVACIIKIADLSHNSDLDRMLNFDMLEGERKKLREKYKKAKAILVNNM